MIQIPRVARLSLLLGCLMTVICAQTESIAILDLDGRGISTVEAASLTDRLRSELVRTGKVTVVERGQMERVLAEQDFQLTGCTSDECAVDVGQLLGVTEMVAGSIGKVGSTFSIDIRVINVATGVIAHSIIRDYRGEIDGLLAEMRVLAADLANLSTPFTEPERPPSPTMSLVTEPVGAQVVLNGQIIDVTPISALELVPDQLQSLVLRLDGYKSVDTTFIATAGQHYELDWKLIPLQSWLSVTSSPSGAVILLSGRRIGKTPIRGFELEPGRSYDLVVQRTGYIRIDTTFMAIPDQFTRFNMALKRVPITSPPPVQARAMPSVRSNAQGGWFMMVIIMAAGGYYGYTEGWFDEWLGLGDETPTVGQPPGLPVE